MNIHEYQAKQVLNKYGVPTSHGIVALKAGDIDNLLDNFNADIYVVKAQIHAGGRGKAGGVKVVTNKDEARKIAHNMMGIKLVTHQTGPSGQIVKRVYVESGCNISKEYYFSVVLDRATSKITFMASTEGGVDIEEVALHHPEKIIKISVDPVMGIQPFHCRSIAFRLGFSGNQAKQMMKIAEATYNAFIGTDASQIEINPLVATTEGNLLALDAKINFDDNGLFRHPDIAMLRDYGSSMTHSFSRRSSYPCNKTDYWFFYFRCFDKFSCFFFSRATNFAYHNNSLGLLILKKHI